MVAFAPPRTESHHQLAKSQTCDSHKNIGDMERFASVVGGGLMLLNAIPSRPMSALLLGGFGAALIFRGITGHCQCYQALGISTCNEAGRVTAVSTKNDFQPQQQLEWQR